ncbi:MAG TPA: PEP-CTERM sorting domain-containing protein, partial [Tepidisphaeraceae bacterium]|nr:PEP-CTERM sorting domain-containing protein [Tepidisphaeraceae bacterium]
VVRLTDSPSKSSWTDGTPTLTATNNPGGVYINNFDGPGRGFMFTVPADLLTRVLKVYVGEFTASGTLEATLSDNSAPAYSQVLTGATNQTVQGVYTIDFAAASLGQTLTVKWTETADLGNSDNITMQAAALSLLVVPEPTTLASLAGLTVLSLLRRRK